jgi:hypothetical protein
MNPAILMEPSCVLTHIKQTAEMKREIIIATTPVKAPIAAIITKTLASKSATPKYFQASESFFIHPRTNKITLTKDTTNTPANRGARENRVKNRKLTS